MKQSLLSTIVQGVKKKSVYYKEIPGRIRITREGSSYNLTNSLAGVVYCIVLGQLTSEHVLVVNGAQVARGGTEIMLWAVDNAPKTLSEAVRLDPSEHDVQTS